MKKTFLILLFFVSFSAFSQTISSSQEKISYSEYDDLKYIASIIPGYKFGETVNRFYENKSTLLFSSLTHSDENRNTIVYLSGTMEFIIKGKSVIKGILKKDGANRFLTVTECGETGCKYYMFVNNEKVWTGSAPVN